MQAPENILLIIYVMEHQCDQEIIPLVVSQLHINITVSQNNSSYLLCVRL